MTSLFILEKIDLMLETIANIDLQILLFFNKTHQNIFFDWLFPFLTDLHKTTWFKVSFIFPLLGLWVYRDGRRGLFFFFMFFLTLALTDLTGGQAIKKTFERPRPFVEHAEVIQRSPASGYSLVSNHAANAAAMAVFLGAHFPPIRIFAAVMAVLISFSRVYNGVHYPTDIVLGGLLGIIIALLVLKFSKKLYKENIYE